MTEEEYIEGIGALWPSDGTKHTSPQLLQLSEEAVEAFPLSAELWCLRGTAIEAWNHPLNPARSANERLDVPLDEALACWNRALAIDPGCVEALEDIGFFHDVYTEDYAAAEDSFRTAIALGGSADGYSGLARVLQETGRTAEAKGLLSPESCPCHTDPAVVKMREEIEADLWTPLDEE